MICILCFYSYLLFVFVYVYRVQLSEISSRTTSHAFWFLQRYATSIEHFDNARILISSSLVNLHTNNSFTIRELRQLIYSYSLFSYMYIGFNCQKTAHGQHRMELSLRVWSRYVSGRCVCKITNIKYIYIHFSKRTKKCMCTCIMREAGVCTHMNIHIFTCIWALDIESLLFSSSVSKRVCIHTYCVYICICIHKCVCVWNVYDIERLLFSSSVSKQVRFICVYTHFVCTYVYVYISVYVYEM